MYTSKSSVKTFCQVEKINYSGDKVILTSSEGREFIADKVFVANNIIFIFYPEKNKPTISDNRVETLSSNTVT